HGGGIPGQHVDHYARDEARSVFTRIGCLGFAGFQSAGEISINDVNVWLDCALHRKEIYWPRALRKHRQGAFWFVQIAGSVKATEKKGGERRQTMGFKSERTRSGAFGLRPHP